MEKKAKNVHTIDVIFPLALLLIFGFCTVTVVLQGAQVYRKTAGGLRANYTVRTAVTYLQEKVRECPDAGRAEIRKEADVDVLRLTQTVKGEEYVTCIYCKDGTLRELFCREGEPFRPEAGQELMPVDSFFAQWEENNLIKFTVSWEGQTEEVFLRFYAKEKDRAEK